jgi:hypothetical protein
MNNAVIRFFSRILIVTMLAFPFQSYAAMTSTEQVASAVQMQAARDQVRNFINRTDVSSQLQALGLDSATAKDRVASMTDAEISTITGKINALPAGASDGGALLLLIAIVVVIYFIVRR